MNECLSDLLSVFIVCSIPSGIVFMLILKLFTKRKVVKKEKEGKYYPEW